MAQRDLTGESYGKLQVLRRDLDRSEGSRIYWHCACSCGSDTSVRTDNLIRGNVSSCGRCRMDGHVSEERSRHGASATKTYRTWAKIIHNAQYASASNSPHRSKSQSVTDHEWPTFELFVEQMGECPEGHGLRRFNTSKPWSAENCHWKRVARRKRQVRSTRRTITYQDRTQTLTAWCRELGIRYKVAYARIYTLGWSIEAAFHTEVRPREGQ